MSNFDVGVMQGRLLPKYNGNYQAHPVGYWQNEFKLASERNLFSIEFILDYHLAFKNPLMHSEGIYEIQELIDSTGVNVRSICVDYLMESPLHSKSISEVNKSIEVILKLIQNVSELGVTNIVIPCVDKSSIKKNQFNYFVKNFKPVIEKAKSKGIFLCLETDLNPVLFLELLEQFPEEIVKVNYDTGNSASLGYDMQEEFDFYGNRITDLHIKDRVVNGGSVELGKGSVDFTLLKKLLNKYSYKNLIIMQAYRDDEGLSIFDKQLEFFRKIIC